VLYKYKKINDLELKRIINLINALYKKGHHIFLNTPAEGCLKRIDKRARPEEEKIGLEYLVDLEMEHKKEFVGAYVINGEENENGVYNQFIDILNKLKAR
jgi:predicted kinase